MKSFKQKDLDNIRENPYSYSLKLSIRQLVDILKYASDKYYETDKPVFSDEVYDILIELLASIDKNNKFLKEIGSSLEKVNKVKLPFYMSSLDKIKMDKKTFDKWISSYKGPYHLSDKIDGVSTLLYFKGNKMSMFTRGNGFYGQNISFLIDEFQNIIDLKKIKLLKGKEIAIRGELVITKKDVKFLKVKNGRNATAGIVNSKPNNFKKDVARKIKFYAYDIVYPDLLVNEQYKLLKKWGFVTPFNLLTSDLNLEYLNRLLQNRRKDSVYDIDGIVVRDNGIHKKISGEKPSYAFAFKNILSDQIAEVKVLDVEWDISKDKILNPVVLVDTVILGGVEIKRATAFNAKYVRNNKIGPGSIIEMVRSGDVIPYITGIIKQSKEWKKPPISYKWTASGTDIVAVFDKKSKQSKIYRKKYNIVLLTHFFSVLGAENIKIGTITRLYKAGYNTIKKIINIKKPDLETIEGFQRRMSEKIYKQIKMSITNVDLPTLMTASNMFGRGWGDKKFVLILNNISFEKLLNLIKNEDLLREKLLNIKGFDTISVNQFVKGIRKFISFLKSHPEIKFNISKKKKKGKLTGKSFVFSGYRNKKLEKLIEDKGGDISSYVSIKTTALIVQDKKKSTLKTSKAKLLDIDIFLENEFLKKFDLKL